MLKLNKLEVSQLFDLTKGGKKLKGLRLELNWANSKTIDVDCSAAFLDKNGKLYNGDSLLYYNSPKGDDNRPKLGDYAIHSGDAIDGGDGEMMVVWLDKTPKEVKKVELFMSIYDKDYIDGRTFDKRMIYEIENIECLAFNQETKEELFRFDGTMKMPNTSVKIAELTKSEDGWDIKFDVVGLGTSPSGLEDVVKRIS